VIWGWKYVGGIKNITSYTNSKKRVPLCLCFIFNPIFKIYIIIVIKCERWRVEYNQIRPHSSLGYRPPDPEAIYPEIQQFDKSFVN